MPSFANFATSIVASGSAINSTSGISLTISAGDGVKFPVPPFSITVWPSGTQPTTANAEIMRVTAVSIDTFTVTRAHEGTTALSGITAGYQVQHGNTAKTLTDLQFFLNAKSYGALGDTQTIYDGAIGLGANTLTSASGVFTSSDANKRITVVGAGTGGACLNTTISAYVSATQVTLANTASTAVSGATVAWGTADGSPIQSVVSAIQAANGGTAYLPTNAYISNTSVTITKSNVTIRGSGYSAAKLYLASSTSPYFIVDPSGTGGIQNITFEGFELDCLSQSSTPGIQLKGGNYATGDFLKHVTFRKCYFRNPQGSNQGAVHILSGRGTTDRGPVTDILFEDCIFDGATQTQVYIDGGQVERLRFVRPKFINSLASCVSFNQPAKSSLTGFEGIDSAGIRSNKDWSIEDGYFNNPLSTNSFIKDINKTGVRGFKILRNFFDVGYSGSSVYAFCIDVEGGNWGLKIKDNTFWKAYKCVSIGQSNNGPWFQTNPTLMDEVSGNTFYKVNQAYDHDSDCFAYIHHNTYIENVTTPYNANYGRHYGSTLHDEIIYNCPTVSGTGSQNAAIVVAPFGLTVRNNTVIDDRLLPNPTTAPTLSTVAGGVLSSRTYYVKYTWENDTGETLASTEATVSVGANQLLKITHPYTSTYGPPTGAKRINWYVSTSSGTETKQGYTWLPWAQETETYQMTQQAISWTEPTSGLISGTALPGSNTTHTILQYGVYEVSGASMIYPNLYEGNDFRGLTSNEIYSASSAYKRIQRNNRTTRDLTFNSTPQLLESIPYAIGSITGATTFDIWNGETQSATFTGNVTATVANGHYVGQLLERRLTMGGSGSYTYTKASNEKLAGGGYTPSTSVGQTDILIERWDGTNWLEISRTLNVS